MGEGREVSIISQRPVTSGLSDLQQEMSFFRGSVSTFLQLVVPSLIEAQKQSGLPTISASFNCLLQTRESQLTGKCLVD